MRLPRVTLLSKVTVPLAEVLFCNVKYCRCLTVLAKVMSLLPLPESTVLALSSRHHELIAPPLDCTSC